MLSESPDLTFLVEAWPSLPVHIKAAIKAMIESVSDNNQW